jgi:hypothetical protein
VSCPFDLAHYAELLDAARRGGYRFATFDREPEPGDLLLRHDVDMALDAALTMAELEAAAGVRATYFVMRRSEFYNLEAPTGVHALERLRELGHRVALHAVYPDSTLDERFDPVIAWHVPEPEYMTTPVEGAVNAMQPGYFHPDKYRSDSNQRWRSGCPHDELASGAFEWLQLLVHPEIWVYPGDNIRETLIAMLEAKRELRWKQFADARLEVF